MKILNFYKFNDNSHCEIIQVVIRLTLNCNQRCCFCNVVSWKNSEELNTNLKLIKVLIYKIFIKYKKSEIKITLSWWEPTLYKDFFYLLDYLALRCNDITIQTNGVNFWNKYFQKNILSKKYKNKLKFYISFHSHNEMIYKIITKWWKNDYENALKGISFLLKSFYFSQISLNYVINKYNLSEIPFFLDFILKNNYFSYNWFDINFSSVIWERSELLLVKYSDIIKIFNDCYDKIIENKIETYWILSHGWTECDIPVCIFKKYTKYNFNYSKYNYKLEKIDLCNTKIDKCKKCQLYNMCPWILKSYLKKFWDNEFNPILKL